MGPCTPFITCADLCCLDVYGELDPTEPCTGHLPDPCTVNGKPVPAVLIHSSIQAATELLWVATGRQFGTCTTTIRPCRQRCGPCGDEFDIIDVRLLGYGLGTLPWFPSMDSQGIWTNIPACGECAGSNCCHVCEIQLPTPVCCVSEVKIDGRVLNPLEYRVDDFSTLVRVLDENLNPIDPNDRNCWPSCQSLTLPDTEKDTFSVTVTWGKAPPELVKIATAEFACQLIKQCIGAPCQLPQRIQNISRQGVTIGMLDPMVFLEKGHTGIYIVDMAINQFNPARLPRRAGVSSPDLQPRWRRTDTGAGGCT